MNVPAFDKNKMPLRIPTRITISIPSIAKDQSGAMGTLLVADNDSAGVGLQSDTCLYSVKADATMNKSLAHRPRKDLGKRHLHESQGPEGPGIVVRRGRRLLRHGELRPVALDSTRRPTWAKASA